MGRFFGGSYIIIWPGAPKKACRGTFYGGMDVLYVLSSNGSKKRRSSRSREGNFMTLPLHYFLVSFSGLLYKAEVRPPIP